MTKVPSSRSTAARGRQRNRTTGRAGLTLIEVMVVISIITIVSWIGFSLIGTLRGTDPLDSASATIRGLVARSRAEALARDANFTLLVDFEKNKLVPLERRPLANFSFESDLGSFGRFVGVGGGAYLTARDPELLYGTPELNGGALAVEGRSPNAAAASARVSFGNELQASAGTDGFAISFALYPSASSGGVGPIVSADELWSVRIEEWRSGTCILAATAANTDVRSEVAIPAYGWSRIEFFVTPVLVQIVVNGIPTTSGMAAGNPDFSAGFGSVVTIGSPDLPTFLMDDLRMDRISLGDPIDLGRAFLLPPLVMPEVAISLGDAWRITDANPDAVISDPNAPPLPLGAAASYDPALGPPRRALIAFDSRGGLDDSLHGGRVVVDLVASYPDGEIQQMEVEIGVSGLVTSRRVPRRVPLDAELGSAAPPGG